MRVAVVTGGRSAQAMGLETAELRLLKALQASADGGDPAVEIRVVGGRSARRYARRLEGHWFPARPGRSSRRAARGVDAVHLAGLSLPPPSSGVPFLATFHDLSPLHFGDEGGLRPWTQTVADEAALLVCPSRFTASELERHLGVPRERIRVIPNGPGHDVSPATEPLRERALATLGLAAPFVLRLGGYTERKNVPLLLEAWPEVHRATGATLALVGPPHAAREAQLARAPALDGVTVLDYLPPAVVPRLLRSAQALVTTSTYEGFGLPALEAMQAGTPVVGVRAPFLEEVCDGAAVLVGNEPQELALGVTQVLTDGALRERLRRDGLARGAAFSWERSARQLLAVYRELA